MRVITVNVNGVRAAHRCGEFRFECREFRAEDEPAAARHAGERGDIVRTMQKALRAEGAERDPMTFAIHDAAPATPVIGRVLDKHLTDELGENLTLVIDGIDGRDGSAGRDGVNGSDGATRATGLPGATGASGVNAFTIASTSSSPPGPLDARMIRCSRPP